MPEGSKERTLASAAGAGDTGASPSMPIVSAAPAEPQTFWKKHVPGPVADRFEVHDFRHAASILRTEFPSHFQEVCGALLAFSFTDLDVRNSGGNESVFPKKFSELPRPNGWVEKRLHSRLVYTDPDTDKEIEQSSDTHKVDYCKGRVALDVEWNSKDQTFDRDLFAFRAFNDVGMISVGVLITRSSELDPYISELGPSFTNKGKESGKPTRAKFGASTTHMGKLLPRIKAGRGGGCPLLVFGITTKSRSGPS